MTDAFAHPRHLPAVDRSAGPQPAGTDAAAPARARPVLRPDRNALPADPGRRRGADSTPALTPTHTLPTDAAPLHEARGLTSGGTQARIHLDGQLYTLRITRQGKLILTK